MEIVRAKGTGYATSTYAPLGKNGCDGLYEAVDWWPNRCPDVAAKVFTHFKAAGKLLRNIQVLEGGPAIRVFLMPAGSGCVSIKKEVVY